MAKIKIPSDKDGFYRTGGTLYYFWLHYLSIKQESDDDIVNSVTYTLRYGTDEPSNVFSVNRKTYDPDNCEVAYDELTELGTREINALLNFLDVTTSDVKLITEDSKGQQEVGVVSRNPDKTSVVLSAYGSEQQFDDSVLKNLIYLDSSSVASGSSTDWTIFGTVSLTVNHVQSEQGLLISKGSYVKSKELQLGDKSCTIEFYSYVDESSSDNSCICEVAHADHDIKLKLLKKINEATGETVTTVGFYLDDTLVTCSKSDIMISNTLNHFAVVYQDSNKVLFFFVNGILVGNTDCSLTENTAVVYFNYDTTTEEKTFTGTIDMVRITGELARWIPDKKIKDYDTATITDKVGSVWQIHDGKIETPPAGQDKFGTGLKFVDKSYATLNTPIMLGGSDFTIDFWYYLDIDLSDKSYFVEEDSGIFTVQVGTTFDLGFHCLGNRLTLRSCLHTTVETETSEREQEYIQCSTSAYTLHHVAIVYVFAEDIIYFFKDGNKRSDVLHPSGRLSTPQEFFLTVGWYNGGGTQGHLKGSVDEFRISAGIARWTENFNTAVEQSAPYEIDEYTKALMRVSSFDSDEGKVDDTPDETFREDDVNLTFYPPQVFTVKERPVIPAKKLMNFYLPFERHFDDSKFLVISKKPVQTDRPTYDGVTIFEPVWNYYDPDQLKMEGDIRSKEAGVHYVTFTPWNDHVWRDGTTKAKISIWIVDRKKISTYPEQEEILNYNSTEQDINLKNYDDDTMTLSGTVKATNANSSDNPYYIAYVTPKDGFVWLTGRNDPYEVRWQIK